jgi:hypothetical protein
LVNCIEFAIREKTQVMVEGIAIPNHLVVTVKAHTVGLS